MEAQALHAVEHCVNSNGQSTPTLSEGIPNECQMGLFMKDTSERRLAFESKSELSGVAAPGWLPSRFIILVHWLVTA